MDNLYEERENILKEMEKYSDTDPRYLELESDLRDIDYELYSDNAEKYEKVKGEIENDYGGDFLTYLESHESERPYVDMYFREKAEEAMENKEGTLEEEDEMEM